jgi:four helix bundle protein
MTLAAEAYRLAALMPKTEQYRLTSQLLRASVSVPANIAEGHARGTRKDYAHFINIARGSVAEVDTLVELAQSVGLVKAEDVRTATALADEIGRMLNALASKLRQSPST